MRILETCFILLLVFWTIFNLFLRTIPAFLSFTANKKKIAINYCVIIRISLTRVLIFWYIFDWLCRGSASPSPCTGGCQCQPEWGLALKGLLWPTVVPTVALIVSGPGLNQRLRTLAPDPCRRSKPLNCLLFTFYWKLLTEILKECLKDSWSMHSLLWPFHGLEALKSLPRKNIYLDICTSNGVYNFRGLNTLWSTCWP